MQLELTQFNTKLTDVQSSGGGESLGCLSIKPTAVEEYPRPRNYSLHTAFLKTCSSYTENISSFSPTQLEN